MIKRRKQKYIFYIPGMISLVLLPLMCLFYFYQNKSFTSYQVMSFGIADTLYNEKPKEQLQNGYILLKRNYNTILFNGPKELDDIKLKQARLNIINLFKSKDSINGIKLSFGKHTTYETFIDALDIIAIEDVPTYLPYKNDIYVPYIPPKPASKNLMPINVITCGYGEANRDLWLKMEQEEERKHLIELFKQQWIIILAYLGIVFLNILALVKFNKNRIYNQKSYI